MPQVVNKYKDNYDIYIGRGSVWGNPFEITETTNRSQAIAKYKKYLWLQIKLQNITVEQLLSLKGKKLGCFCKPQSCHGDVIVGAVEWAETQNTP